MPNAGLEPAYHMQIQWYLKPHSIFAAVKRRVETFISRLKAANIECGWVSSCPPIKTSIPKYRDRHVTCDKLSSWDWEENVEWQVEVTARCRFQRIRRNTEVHSFRRRILDFQAICSPLDRAATMREQVWMSIGDAQPTVTWLLLRRACTLALRWAPTRQGAGLSGRQVARPAGWCPRFAREKRHCEERMLLTEVWVAIELFVACRWSRSPWRIPLTAVRVSELANWRR